MFWRNIGIAHRACFQISQLHKRPVSQPALVIEGYAHFESVEASIAIRTLRAFQACPIVEKLSLHLWFILKFSLELLQLLFARPNSKQTIFKAYFHT